MVARNTTTAEPEEEDYYLKTNTKTHGAPIQI